MTADSPYSPRLIFWEVTAGCNLRCVHCRATAAPRRYPEELTTAEAFRFIDEVASFAQPILILSGGEPLFRSDIFEIAAYATQKGLRVALATNGTLVTRETAEQIAAAGIKRVSISLDGATATTHDEFRAIKGSFVRALRGMADLKKVGMSLQINTTIAKHNVAESPAILNLALSLGADALHVFLLVPVGCGMEIAAEQMLSAQEYEVFLGWFYERSQDVDIELKATCAPHYFRILRQRRAEGGSPPKGSSHSMAAHTKGCLAGSGVFFVSYKGDVYPCGYLPVNCGNIRRQAVADIWASSEVFRDLRDPQRLKGKCGRCAFRWVCEGCRARAYAASGDYMSEEPCCVYEPEPNGVNLAKSI